MKKNINIIILLSFCYPIFGLRVWGQGMPLVEGFETGLPTSYTPTTSYSLSSGTWTGQANGVIRSTTGVNSGSYSCQLRSQTGAQIISPNIASGGVSTVTFWSSASTASGSMQVNYSTDGGTNWNSAVESPFSLTTGSAVQRIATINSNSPNILIQFYRTAATVYLDDIVISSYEVPSPSLLLEENFNYTSNQKLTDNSWIAHSSADQEPITVNNGGLTFTTYPSVSGNAALLDNTGEDVSKSFTEQTFGSIYFSFLVKVTTIAEGYFIHLISSSSAFNARVFMGGSGSNLNFGISKDGLSASVSTGDIYSTNTNYLVVCKYEIVSGSDNDKLSLFIYQDGDNFSIEPGISTLGPITTGVDINPTKIGLRQYSSTQTIIIDGIRVSNSWEQAPVPVELSSFSAYCQGNAVNLKWQTKTEVENYGFEIERASSLTSPIQDWTKIGFVNGHGNCNSPKDYTFTDKTVTSGKYVYRLKQIDTDGQYEFSKEVEVDLGTPKTFYLGQNYPNPFNPSTKIDYSLPVDGEVKLALYTLEGELVNTLVNERQNAGNYSVEFNAENLSSGMYIYKLMSNGFVQTKKMMLAK